LVPLDVTEIKEVVEKGEQGKKTKALWEAYKIASEEHDLDHFKGLLKTHEALVRAEEQRLAEEEAKRLAKKDKKKSKTDADGDVEMGDGEEPAAKKKPSKKRKKEDDGDAPKVRVFIGRKHRY
jgi:hypothetical protein